MGNAAPTALSYCPSHCPQRRAVRAVVALDWPSYNELAWADDVNAVEPPLVEATNVLARGAVDDDAVRVYRSRRSLRGTRGPGMAAAAFT